MDKPEKLSFWKKLLFVLYGIICVLAFTYMKFPYYALKPKFEKELSKISRMDISVSTIKPVLPIGWTLGGVKIQNEHVLDSLTLKPRILPLFVGDIAVSIKMTEKKGYLKGSLGTSFLDYGRDVNINFDLKDFELSVIKNFVKKYDEISGAITGIIDISYDKNHPERADGEIELVVNNGQIPLNVPNFPIAAIPFSKFELNAKIEKGLLKLSKAELLGNDISGNMRGDLKFGGSLNSSDINFIIGLKFSQSYKAMLGPSGNDNIKIIIGGTLGSPRTSIE